MQLIKESSDELASFGQLMDHEDLIEKILDGLGDDHQSVIDVVNDRETPISFDELHEKLINKELSLQRQQSTSTIFPTTVHPIAPHPRSGNQGNRNPRRPAPWMPTMNVQTPSQNSSTP